MRLIKVAAAALNQTPLDWDANAENIRQAIAKRVLAVTNGGRLECPFEVKCMRVIRSPE